MKKKYSVFSLAPKDITDKNEFWRFKIDEMRTSIFIYTVFCGIEMIVNFVFFLVE